MAKNGRMGCLRFDTDPATHTQIRSKERFGRRENVDDENMNSLATKQCERADAKARGKRNDRTPFWWW